MKRVAIVGAQGKMGQQVVEALSTADDLELVACIDPAYADEPCQCLAGENCGAYTDLAEALDAAEPDVLVDFTRPDVVADNLRVALPRNIDCVVGTTGLSDETLTELAELGDENTCLFVAPNFAVGAVLLMKFAKDASKVMEKAEIIELHHDKKLDKPSGTALRTAQMMEGDPEIHSVRLPGLVAHQEVILGDVGQTLTLRHDSIDRTSFMPGVLLACREVGDRSGLIVGLEHFLDLE
ncbi:MAG: 4-hydroxy-tetrahydrodipicolinate reductase [Actinomycetia bacterium]|nr:4-hydroxy-tetrahydrodipicolinate reductase [Actinomycetes bacterium]